MVSFGALSILLALESLLSSLLEQLLEGKMIVKDLQKYRKTQRTSSFVRIGLGGVWA